jgi:hypothetical protein
MELLHALGRMFGYRRMRFDLDESSLSRLVWVSVLPVSVITAASVWTLGSYEVNNASGSGFGGQNAWDEAFWIGRTGMEVGVPLSLAAAFAAGLGGWSRGAGSWALVVGAVLMFAAAGFGAASIGLILSEGLFHALELRLLLWTEWSVALGFLAIGYFFLAHRGGQRQRGRRRLSRRYSALS